MTGNKMLDIHSPMKLFTHNLKATLTARTAPTVITVSNIWFHTR
nr:MAG TPA: hypothetical protein [Microviridae sp.]